MLQNDKASGGPCAISRLSRFIGIFGVPLLFYVALLAFFLCAPDKRKLPTSYFASSIFLYNNRRSDLNCLVAKFLLYPMSEQQARNDVTLLQKI